MDDCGGLVEKQWDTERYLTTQENIGIGSFILCILIYLWSASPEPSLSFLGAFFLQAQATGEAISKKKAHQDDVRGAPTWPTEE